jgi:mono/diheme cytochrome c family protein
MDETGKRIRHGLWLLLCATLFLGQPASSMAQEDEPGLAWGKDLFLTRCASCHGEDGKGNGPAAVALKNPPADLTQISKKNGGTFPRAQVIRFIDGERPVPAHGPRHMPVWGEVFREERTDSEARMRLLSLTTYLESIQEK